MISNIEPIAREISRGICRDSEMPETQIEQMGQSSLAVCRGNA
jgi:hypothetical protein